MPHRCPAHDRAHIALLDWAAHWIRLSERAHYASMNWDSVARLGCRVQRPTKPVAPRIQFTPYRGAGGKRLVSAGQRTATAERGKWLRKRAPAHRSAEKLPARSRGGVSEIWLAPRLLIRGRDFLPGPLVSRLGRQVSRAPWSSCQAPKVSVCWSSRPAGQPCSPGSACLVSPLASSPAGRYGPPAGRTWQAIYPSAAVHRHHWPIPA